MTSGLSSTTAWWPAGEADDLAEELLVDLPEDVGGEDGELVGAVGVVEPLDDVLERLVVDGQGEGQARPGGSAASFSWRKWKRPEL